MKVENIETAKTHLREHVTYPATKQDIVTACNNMSDHTEADKQEVREKLPDQTYSSAGEVIQALGW